MKTDRKSGFWITKIPAVEDPRFKIDQPIFAWFAVLLLYVAALLAVKEVDLDLFNVWRRGEEKEGTLLPFFSHKRTKKKRQSLSFWKATTIAVAVFFFNTFCFALSSLPLYLYPKWIKKDKHRSLPCFLSSPNKKGLKLLWLSASPLLPHVEPEMATVTSDGWRSFATSDLSNWTTTATVPLDGFFSSIDRTAGGSKTRLSIWQLDGRVLVISFGSDVR